jgi:tetrahydromethanopterin S-methyltransferase subunit G
MESMLKVALNTIKQRNNDNANILFCLLNRSIGSIVGAVIGSLIGLAILIVIVVVVSRFELTTSVVIGTD